MSQDLQQTNPNPILGGRYKIINHLAAGGFGQTFLAQDTHLPGQPQCVVKKLKPQTHDADTLLMARRLFDTEAKVLYQLGNHDQIPRLLAHFEETEEFYLVQEFIEGEPLTEELAGSKLWPETEVTVMLMDILQVLEFVHEQQVIHRDIKPPNLIRRKSDGKIVLIDFGAVKQVSSQVVDPTTGETNLTISIGTKGYMPNEQLAGNPRFSSDVHAVGMLGIQALTGLHPKRFSENPQTGEIDWRKYARQVSPELAAVLDQMVRYDFRDRYPSATEALEALRSLPEFLKGSQLPSEPLPEDRKRLLELELQQLPTRIPESAESEIEEPPTHRWVSAEFPVKSATVASDADFTEPLNSSPSPQLPEQSMPASAPVTKVHRRWLKFWPVLALLVFVGTTTLMTKTFLSSHTANLSAYFDPKEPAKNPSPSPVQSPKPTPSPLTPEQQAAEFLKQADSLRKAGQYQEALNLYDKAIDQKPNFPQAYWGRCDSLNKLKKPAEAVVACNDALDLKPNYAEALWGKGMAYEQQKLRLEALQLYEKATRIQPNFTEAWVSYGVTLQSFGRSEEAIRALNKGIALKRDYAVAWAAKGEALWNLGRVEPAIAALDKALEIQPDQPKALKLRQRIREKLGR